MLSQSARKRLNSSIARQPLDKDGGSCFGDRDRALPAVIGTTSKAMDAESTGEKRQKGRIVRPQRGTRSGFLSGTNGSEAGGAPADVIISREETAVSSGDTLVALSGPDKGLALIRPGGYPCDADAVRRYMCYCFVVVMTVLWHDTAKELGLA